MHNLIKKDLEKLDILPREQHSRKYHDDWYGRGGSDWHYVEDYGPNTIANRVLKKFENKTFDEAFAYYCTLVPKYQQKFFAQQIETEYNRYWRNCYILENGIIKKMSPKDKKIYTFYSDDYTYCYRHKVTGREITKETYWSERMPKDPHRCYSNYVDVVKKDFEIKVLTGWSKSFESKEDPRYLRLLREQQKRKKIKENNAWKALKQKVYCFMTKDELEKKKLAKTDELTRDRHGFDKTTFKGIEYHGQKRKRKDL